MRKFCFTCSVLLLLCLLVQVEGHSEAWLAQPFSYHAVETPLKTVLRDFCRTQRVTAIISDKIEGRVSGNFVNLHPADFIDLIAQNFALSWYFDGSAVYFYSNTENKSQIINLGVLTSQELESMLMELGVYSPRYPWREKRGGEVIYLNAPPKYVEIVTNLVSEFGQAAAQKRIMRLYKLQNAWAADQNVSLMDQNVTVPGVATLLQQIVLGQKETDADQDSSNQPATVKKLKDMTPPVPGGSNSSQSGTGNTGVLDTGLGSGSQYQGPRILADPRLNAVLVWDIRERQPYYDEIIKTLDVPVSLVEIRGVIMDVSTQSLQELGVRWQGRGTQSIGNGQTIGAVGGINVDTAADAAAFATTIGEGLNITTIYTKGLAEVMARVHALESQGDARVLSRPAVLTLDNVQAQVETTQTFYIRIAGTYDTDLYKVDSGTVLKVTPHVIESNGSLQIKLLVSIEDGAPDQGSTVDNIPLVRQSTINTQAVVEQGQSLVIGGHYYEQLSDTVDGIPVLMDIPVLGYLFKSKSKSSQKMERIFIITPRVISRGQQTVAETYEPPQAPRGSMQSTTAAASTVASSGQSGDVPVGKNLLPPPWLNDESREAGSGCTRRAKTRMVEES